MCLQEVKTFAGKLTLFKYAVIVIFVAVQYTAFKRAWFELSNALWVMLIAPVGFV